MTDTHEDEGMSLDAYRTQIVTQQAVYWVCRLNVPHVSRDDRRKFVRWLKRSPENIAAILWMVGFDGNFKRRKLLDCVVGLKASNVIEFDFGARRDDYQPSESVSNEVPRKNKVSEHAAWKSKLGSRWSMVAAVAVLTVALLFAFFGLNATPEGVVETRAAQLQTMTLDDGSTVHLDARTRIKVEFTAELRIVHLYHGSAVFDVMKDSRRPFIVSTDDVDVTAVGTRFGVAIDNGVTTTVEEGVVKVKPRDGGEESSVLLHRGQQLHVRAARAMMLSVADIAQVDAGRELSWVTGRLEMRNTTLGEIARQFNRRQALRAEIKDAELANRPVGLAMMQIENVDDFIEVMESRGVTVIREGSTLILRAEKTK